MSNAALRRQIVRQARHLRRGRRGPCPFFVADPADPDGGRVEVGEEVPTLFFGVLPGNLGIVLPLEHHVSDLSPQWTWRDVQRGKLRRGDTRIDAYVHAMLEAREKAALAAKAETDAEMRPEVRKMLVKAVTVPMRGARHDAIPDAR